MRVGDQPGRARNKVIECRAGPYHGRALGPAIRPGAVRQSAGDTCTAARADSGTGG